MRQASNVMIIMERAGPMGPTFRNFKKVAATPRLARPVCSIEPKVVEIEEEVQSDAGVAMQGLDSEMVDVDLPVDPPVEGGLKRPAATPPSQPRGKKEKAGPSPKKLIFPGFTTVDCGTFISFSCQYHPCVKWIQWDELHDVSWVRWVECWVKRWVELHDWETGGKQGGATTKKRAYKVRQKPKIDLVAFGT